MNFKKSLITCAVGTALGVGMVAAQAAVVSVNSWTLTDFNSDGLQSDFNFVTAPSGSSTNKFGAGTELCGTSLCADIDMSGASQGVNVFTTGFNFGGGGDFTPYMDTDSSTVGTPSGSIQATIDTTLAAGGDGAALQFSSLDWAGVYQGVNAFLLGPDHFVNCTGAAAGLLGTACGQAGTADTNPILGNPLGYNVQVTDLGAGDYGVVVDWTGTITEAGGFFGDEPTGVSRVSCIPPSFLFRQPSGCLVPVCWVWWV